MEYFGTSLTECGHYRWKFQDGKMVNYYNRFSDLPFHPENLTNNMKNGSVIFYQGGGLTVLGICGSCKDDRPGSKSIFWVNDIISKEQMIEEVKNNELAMKIINALPFEINW